MEIKEVRIVTDLCWFDDTVDTHIPPGDLCNYWRMYTEQPITNGNEVSIKTTLDIEVYPTGNEESVIGNIKTALFAKVLDDDKPTNDAVISLAVLLIEHAKMLYREDQLGKINYSASFMVVSRESILEALKGKS